MDVPPSAEPRRRYAATIASFGEVAGLRDLLLGFPTFGCALAALLLFLGSAPAAFVVALASLCVTAVLGLGRLTSRVLARQKPVTVSVENETLVVMDASKQERRVPLSDLRSGRVVREKVGSAGVRVVLSRRWGQRLTLQLREPGEARLLLRELKLSARERPATFRFF